MPDRCHRESVRANVFEELDTRLQTWSRDQDMSAGVLLTQAGTTIFEGCYGLADRSSGAPITPRTRFGLASVTKMFTAVAVADLVAAGRLRFSDAVADVLPVSRRPSTLHSEVTIHHLLTHTSGIADYAEEDEALPWYVEDYGDLWAERPSYSMLRPADFLPLFGDRPPNHKPGEEWHYSNAGYILLGLVIEEVSGRPYVDVVQERVFDRAEMSASGFFRLDEARPDVAVGYLPRGSGDDVWRSNIYRTPVIGGADGGAFSTPRDIDRFLTRLDDGTLAGDVRAQMLARHANAEDDLGYGYGLIHYPDGRIGHGGGDPGVEALVHRIPAEDVNQVVLCNCEGFAGQIRDVVLEAWRRS